MQATEIDEQLLEDLYTWIDEIPLSRPKKDLKRDFSDGVLIAEVVKHYHPNLVELHNYPPALAVAKKAVNWHILNRKVFKKLGFEVSDEVINNLTNCKPWAMEQFLLMLRQKLISLPNEGGRCGPASLAGGNEAANYHNSSVNPVMQATEFSPEHRPKLTPSSSKSSTVSKISSVSRRDTNTGLPGLQSPGSLAGHVMGAGAGAGDMVPKVLLDEKLKELLAKDETIQILQAKIRRFEHLLQLKDIRIEDLQTRLQQLTSTIDQPISTTVKNGVGRVQPARK